MNTQNTTYKSLTSLTSLSVLAMLFSACSPADDTSSAPAPTESAITALILNDEPTNTLSVFDAKEQAKPGEAIQVSGQIGGTLKPFIEGYAGFVLADPSLEFCNEMGDDHCSTPWDACCEDPNKIKSMCVSVQFVDTNGNPLQADLRHSMELKELDQVSVVGTVAATSTDTNVIINATGLYKQ